MILFLGFGIEDPIGVVLLLKI